MEKQEAEVEFDLVELLYRVFASWKLILALCIAGVLIAGCCTHFFITPMYKASSTIYVVTQKESAIDL
ncbi:MAG: polysaccharide export protein, partial [Oscillospiraceae bacterium]|nr:polysaccharide export protein [Oscillospiraceae bacterium]